MNQSYYSIKSLNVMRKQIAWTIDYLAISPIRFVFLVVWFAIFGSKRNDFIKLFALKFGSISQFNPQNLHHINTLIYSAFFKNIMIACFVALLIGPIYTILLICWKGRTLGHMATGTILLTSKTKERPQFIDVLKRVVVSYIPFFLSFWVFYYSGPNKTLAVLIVIFIFIFWYDLSLIFNRKIGVHDVVSGTELFYIGKEKSKTSDKNKKDVSDDK